MKQTFSLMAAALLLSMTIQASDAVEPKIAWYGTLQSGLAEAKRSNRPILLLSAAPQCLGVSGIW